ncbi:MAG: AAA family ATPase, partial [Candidatus Margulisiibacteriota bacterium]
MVKIEKLRESLNFYNPWWRTGRVPDELKLVYQRPILRKLISYLNLDRIVVLKGPRRTGKSTLLYQIIDSLILNGVSPQSILYLSFDDIDARAELSLIIKAYEEILSKNIAETKETYCLLDEVHFLDNWSFQIKKYFDRKFPIKFIVSGSSASLIKKGAESLAGRTVEEIILPFSFKEYLAFKTKDKALFEILD